MIIQYFDLVIYSILLPRYPQYIHVQYMQMRFTHQHSYRSENAERPLVTTINGLTEKLVH
jgi:hypothetical protein